MFEFMLFMLPPRFIFELMFELRFIFEPIFEFMFEFMFPPMLEFMFEFVFVVVVVEFMFPPMFEFMFEFMLLLVVVVVVVVEVVLVLVLALLVLSLEQPAQSPARVSKDRRAKVRRIEFPPVPKGSDCWGAFADSRAVTLERFRNSSVSKVYSYRPRSSIKKCST